VVDSLEAALWAFHRADDFRGAVLLAVNLGDDTDTTGAVVGQLAGAHYGEDAIPAGWRARLVMRDRIGEYAEKLFGIAQARIAC
jgi:ADP-ribosylglycohydrolase